MRICPKCLNVYGQSITMYCHFDGERTFDTESIEAEESVNKLKKKVGAEK